jgi:hypothetical protein
MCFCCRNKVFSFQAIAYQVQVRNYLKSGISSFMCQSGTLLIILNENNIQTLHLFETLNF